MARGTTVTHAEHGATVAAPSLAADTVGIDDEVLLKMSEAIPKFAEVTQNAHAATDFEHRMTFGEALRLYLLDCWTAPCMSGRFYTEPQE
jgi:hypothetical protein